MKSGILYADYEKMLNQIHTLLIKEKYESQINILKLKYRETCASQIILPFPV